MPEKFTVFELGKQPLWDTREGNTTAENAGSLVGQTFGGPGDALVNYARSFAPGSTGYSSGRSTAYDMAQDTDTFTIDGGPDQVFDATAVFDATITYVDGTTARISAVVFQDNDGNTYLAPEYSQNADQAALEAGPIRSLTIKSMIGNRWSGLTARREDIDYVTCFTPGAMIATPKGERPVETLRVGDLATTREHGAQPIRWIGRGDHEVVPNIAPIEIKRGALGPGAPRSALLVSPQHRLLVQSDRGDRLIPARKLLPLPGVRVARGKRRVTYIHLLMDRHEVIFANGTPTESLFAGPMALHALGRDQVRELKQLMPDVLLRAAKPACPLADGPEGRRVVAALKREWRAQAGC